MKLKRYVSRLKMFFMFYRFVVGWLMTIDGLIRIVSLGFLNTKMYYKFIIHVSRKHSIKKQNQQNI